MSQEGHSCQRKEIHITGRKFLSQEGIPAMRRKLLLKERHSCYRKEIPVTGTKFIFQEGNSFKRRNISDIESTIPLKEEGYCYREIMLQRRRKIIV